MLKIREVSAVSHVKKVRQVNKVNKKKITPNTCYACGELQFIMTVLTKTKYVFVAKKSE